MDDADRTEALRGHVTRWLNHNGAMTPAQVLTELAADAAGLVGDRYGHGGEVTALEAEVVDLLGKPAAVVMPTGTMAQQIALRIHADRRGSRTVLHHPLAHPHLHEDEALVRMHGLVSRPVGDAARMLVPADLDGIAERPAALLLELPQREIGGWLPSWGQLEALTGWARERDVAVHMDGARLWESQPFYDRPHADIAALFDTVYVSFYKGLGAVAGACLAGPEDVIAQAREWRHRHGGDMFALWPIAAHARRRLASELPEMPARLAHARAIAAALADIDGVEVVPEVPHTPMMHLSLRATAATVRANATRLAAADRLWTWPGSMPTDRPSWQRVELTVGSMTMGFTAEEVADIVGRMITPLPDDDPAQELVEVLDDAGAVVDVVTRARMREDGLRHRCTYVAVVDSQDRVVVHRRADWKDVYPGWWDLAFGGICDVGEPWEEAARRELAEEAGLHDVPLELLGEVEWAGDGAALQGRVYLTRTDAEPEPDDGEVVAVDRVPLADLDRWLAEHQVCTDSAALVPDLLAAVRSDPA